MTAINQKEYLKKYLGIGKAPGEKKKKKKKIIGDRLKIIDDDADVSISREIQEDISAANEDAPQIVAVIDERPPSLRIDETTKNNLWKPIGDVIDITNPKTLKLSTSFKLNKQIKPQTSAKFSYKSKKSQGAYESNKSGIEIKEEVDSSPKRNRNADISPRRVRRSIDQSPPRSIKIEDDSPRKKDSEDDYSPPRKKNKDGHNSKSYIDNNNSPTRLSKSRDKDNSPLRKRDNDISPPRRKNRNASPPPDPRKRNDLSPSRKKTRDSHSPRTRRTDDISPPRKRNREETKTHSPRSKSTNSTERNSRWGHWSPESSPQRPSTSDKTKTTLDGKKAGLQNAKDLSLETALLRQKEDVMFQNMSAEVSGRNAATVARASKKTSDPEEDARQLEKARETKEKYDRWGKGVKQVEARHEKIADQLHEMSKPLARYADDEDLERYLKEQERDGDPMLAYMRKKKRKHAVAAGIPEKPTYMGEFMPNRFGITPGYRWDGVDRSNGYEKKWFEVQNAKKASQEEAFKWSTEDM